MNKDRILQPTFVVEMGFMIQQLVFSFVFHMAKYGSFLILI